MKRHSGRKSESPCELVLPTSLLDFLAAIVLIFAANVSKVGGLQLPYSRTLESTAAKATASRSGNHLELLADGSLRYQGKAVKLQGLGQKLAAEADQSVPILVSPVTTADGQGALQTWFELVIELNEAKQWSRIQLLKRSPPRKPEGTSKP